MYYVQDSPGLFGILCFFSSILYNNSSEKKKDEAVESLKKTKWNQMFKMKWLFTSFAFSDDDSYRQNVLD